MGQSFGGSGGGYGGGGNQPGSWLVTEETAELEERTIWFSVSLPDVQTLSMKAVPPGTLRGGSGFDSHTLLTPS